MEKRSCKTRYKIEEADARSIEDLESETCTPGGVTIAVKNEVASVVDAGCGKVGSLLEEHEARQAHICVNCKRWTAHLCGLHVTSGRMDGSR